MTRISGIPFPLTHVKPIPHLISANENHLKSCDVTVESNSTSVQKPVYLVQYKMSVYFYWQRHDQSDYFKVYIPLSFSGR